jgi:hypothetical protein
MTCAICTLPIGKYDVVNNHHVIYRSQGGIQTKPTHRECHVRYDYADRDQQGDPA